jgi:GNAT superfamily N-acetyltransferase
VERFFPTPAVAADAAAVTEVVVALETSLHGQTTFSQADLEDEWSDLDLEQNARVVRDGDRIVGYGLVRERGERWRVEGYVHPDALGRGIGRLIATGLEEDAARRGARRIQNAVFEADSAARRLLDSLSTGPCACSGSCVSSSTRRRPRPDGPTAARRPVRPRA